MSSSDVVFRIATSETERLQSYAVRAIVFIGEQRCPFAEEFDAWDAEAVHVVGEHDGEPVAAARWRTVHGAIKLERIAILPAFRGHGVGHALVEYLLESARERGARSFMMHAQVHLEAFYAAHGFERRGPVFSEAGIDHVKMVREGG